MQQQYGDDIGIRAEFNCDWIELVVFGQREETEEEQSAREKKEEAEERLHLLESLTEYVHPTRQLPMNREQLSAFVYERSRLYHQKGWDKMSIEQLKAELEKQVDTGD
jgi:hypothetical protein